MLGGCTIIATAALYNLGVTMDSCVDSNTQVSTIVKACNYTTCVRLLVSASISLPKPAGSLYWYWSSRILIIVMAC